VCVLNRTSVYLRLFTTSVIRFVARSSY